MIEMKVLFVCGGNNPDFRIAPFIVSQAESLRRQGIKVDFFIIEGKGISGYASQIRPLRRMIRAGGYDLVHAHYTFSGWVARLANHRVPLVVSYMGSDFAGIFRNDGRRRLKSLLMVAQGMLLNLFVKHIIVKSEGQLKLLPLKKRGHIIPNGVDFNTFRPAPMQEARNALGLDPAKQFVLFLGNPSDPRKNFTLAREAFAIANRTVDIELLCPYPVSHEKVPHYLNAANLLLFTSWFEGSSNLLKEALACNCPVVATPAGDAEHLLSGVKSSAITGYLPEEAAGHIVRIIGEGSRSDGRACIAHLREEAVAERLIRLYQECDLRSESDQ
ncbi:MAG: glycosyltransferase [Bacteroidales bacterium]